MKKHWINKLNSARAFTGAEIEKQFRSLGEETLNFGRARGTHVIFPCDETDGKLIIRKRSVTSQGKSIKSTLSEREVKALTDRAGIPWDDRYTDRVISHWASDERVDAHGDIVMQNWDFSQFAKNPAMPFNHDWDGLPVGVHLDWQVRTRSDGDYTGPALFLQSLYALPEQLPVEMGDSLFRLTQARMLRMNSVGFFPQRVIWIEDEEERSRLGLGRFGHVLDNNILLEDSPTLIGANQGALVAITNSAAKKHAIQFGDLQTLRELSRRSSKNEREFEKVDDVILEVSQLIFNRALPSHRDFGEEFDMLDELLYSEQEAPLKSKRTVISAGGLKAAEELEEEEDSEEEEDQPDELPESDDPESTELPADQPDDSDEPETEIEASEDGEPKDEETPAPSDPAVPPDGDEEQEGDPLLSKLAELTQTQERLTNGVLEFVGSLQAALDGMAEAMASLSDRVLELGDQMGVLQSLMGGEEEEMDEDGDSGDFDEEDEDDLTPEERRRIDSVLARLDRF
jgi:hypothetical protein